MPGGTKSYIVYGSQTLAPSSQTRKSCPLSAGIDCDKAGPDEVVGKGVPSDGDADKGHGRCIRQAPCPISVSTQSRSVVEGHRDNNIDG